MGRLRAIVPPLAAPAGPRAGMGRALGLATVAGRGRSPARGGWGPRERGRASAGVPLGKAIISEEDVRKSPSSARGHSARSAVMLAVDVD